MSGFYRDGDTEREIREALRLGATLEFLAGKLPRCSPEKLASVLNLPQAKPAKADRAESEFDLWASDRLAEVL